MIKSKIACTVRHLKFASVGALFAALATGPASAQTSRNAYFEETTERFDVSVDGVTNSAGVNVCSMRYIDKSKARGLVMAFLPEAQASPFIFIANEDAGTSGGTFLLQRWYGGGLTNSEATFEKSSPAERIVQYQTSFAALGIGYDELKSTSDFDLIPEGAFEDKISMRFTGPLKEEAMTALGQCLADQGISW